MIVFIGFKFSKCKQELECTFFMSRRAGDGVNFFELEPEQE